MNIWTKFFQPPKHIKELDDPELVKKQYKYWRIRIFYSMFIGYVFYYFTRKSFTFAMPTLMTDLGFDKAQLGIIGSTLYISYGISKFVSGVISDQSNPRYFMALGLIVTGFTNIFFGMSSSILLFALWWGLNGWFQGWGWPPCARLLTHWYSKSERGTWWSVWSTSHNIGGALIPILTGFAIDCCGWRGAMFIPGVLCILMGLVLINRLRDTPQSLGLPSIEKFRKKQEAQKHEETTADILEEEAEKELSTREILLTYVLKNKWIWLLSFASFFIYVVRMAVNDWSALFLIETKRYVAVKANFCVSLFEIGGLFGMLIAGWLSDKISKGKRGPMNVVFSLGLLFSILSMWYSRNQDMWWLDGSLLFIIGFFLFGPQMMIGLAAAELSHKKAAGTASGFAGWFAYFGAAFAGYPLGKIAQDWGWRGFFIALLGCALLALVLFLPTWNASERSLQTRK
ncbi:MULTISPECIES: MFS transporter [Chlamydia]|uniref:Regulatory protein uhpC n=2 Tax=Chlamydia TaxID=810 RepID=A0ABN0MPC6_CHLPS|nr:MULTISPECIES: MFS transporter [Chlamydia]AFS19070.1 uhpC [Chlamydia psittaci 84/55]AFS22265.1 uhpC [Chlamydia psittaci VS225]AGE74650.1 putative hexose phosphate transport protein [Chlamydia psittaci Mat116]EPJ15901.1 regulatory protein uhpC [Chlamydia psittaci 02DC18]EPJ17215.1 regulatory protein uhpC [Chlamydia psittaci 02DC22]EPJ20860.1 regulatory protein uhpC [Chlamydia psittaci 02DC21]EPJ25254.1 regulatory protein uhpC [Chlamydia psittaci 09DC77]EPJ30409.1 regulatory protein uhpC [C